MSSKTQSRQKSMSSCGLRCDIMDRKPSSHSTSGLLLLFDRNIAASPHVTLLGIVGRKSLFRKSGLESCRCFALMHKLGSASERIPQYKLLPVCSFFPIKLCWKVFTGCAIIHWPAQHKKRLRFIQTSLLSWIRQLIINRTSVLIDAGH